MKYDILNKQVIVQEATVIQLHDHIDILQKAQDAQITKHAAKAEKDIVMVQDKGSAAKWDKELHQLQFMLKILERNPTFVDMPSKSPQLWHQLLQYKKGLLRNIDICNWDLEEYSLGDEEKDKIAVYSCDDLCTLKAVY